MQYTFDNSAENPRNPQQPPQRVLWGQRTTDEMGDLWIQVLTRDDRDLRTLTDAIEPKEMREDLVGYDVMTRRDPSNVLLHDDAAVLSLNLGRTAQAIAHFEQSARLRPDSARAHFNLGTALTLAGRPDDSIAEFRRALAINPDYAIAHNNLGNVLLMQGNASDALQQFRETLRLDPANAEAHYNVGSLARARGDWLEALSQFRQALTLNAASTTTQAGLAWILAAAPDPSLRDPSEAVRMAEHMAGVTERKDAVVLDLLAAAYASAGQFDRAVETSQAALDLKPPAPIAAAMQKRLELYRQRQPYVAPDGPSRANVP
jgi:tetratricopeptide (TPR) repeat protein